MKIKALSIVAPNGIRIAKGEKTLEVRSWLPDLKDGEDLLIVENQKYLRHEAEVDEGVPVAIVNILRVRDYFESDILAACATRWEPGYYSWELTNVRPVNSEQTILAARGIYEVELNLGAEIK